MFRDWLRLQLTYWNFGDRTAVGWIAAGVILVVFLCACGLLLL